VQSTPQQPAVSDEDPVFAGRRRQEKNFSDLFGTQMGERNQIKDREEVLASKTCSFLDTRGEIAARNKGRWKDSDDVNASSRKEAERDSRLFDFECPNRPDMEPDHRVVNHHERVCWDTKDIMQSGSEIARRRRLKDHHPVEGAAPTDNMQVTAHNRKQDDLGSAQIRSGLGTTLEHRPAPFSPRSIAAGSPTVKINERFAVTAKETKRASLQSSIFS
jgi:hypothetical protein